MSRKSPSFAQLIEYMSDIDKSDEQYNVYQNVFSRRLEDLEQEFMRNSEYMAKRKNGNYLYHEILSISKAEHLEDHKQKKILRDIAYEYSKRRANNNLVFGTLHDDHEDHLHYHLLISANAVSDEKRTRLSKSKFDKLKKDLEERVLTQYPELEQKVTINKQAKEKLSNKGSEQKRRTGKTPQRDDLKAKLQDIFSKSRSKEAFFDALSEAGLEFYARGNTLGVKDLSHNRNHRLKTLGVLGEFNELSRRIELESKQEAKSDKSKPEKEAKQQQTTETQADNQEKPESERRTEIKDDVTLQQEKRKSEMDEIREEKQSKQRSDKSDSQDKQ